MPRSELRNKKERDTRRMRDGFIFMPDKFRQCCKEILRANNYLVMICPERARHQSRVFEFVCFTLFKCNRESLDRLGNHPAHHRGYR